MVESEQMEDGRMDVVQVGSVLYGFKTELVGRAVFHPAADVATGEPHREPIGIVIASRLSLPFAEGHAAEFAPPNDQRALQKPPLLQVRQQGRDGLIHFRRMLAVIGLDALVGILGFFQMAPTGVKLHEAHTPLDESPGNQAIATELIGRLFPDTVHRLR